MENLNQTAPENPEQKENKKDTHILGEIAGGYLLSSVMVACLSLWAVACAGISALS